MERAIFSLSVMLLLSSALCAQKSPVFITGNVAIKEYDAVAYFKQRKPVKGNKNFSYSWNGANWYFSSKQNLDSFKTSPQKFAPQFGGYCAYGMAEGHKAPTDPNAWTIVNGKLYLNYSLDVKEKWIKNQKERIDQANK